MQLRFWGVRALAPQPLSAGEFRRRLQAALTSAQHWWPESISAEALLDQMPDDISSLVGGETPCVEIQTGGERLIVDMGTGARRLGYDLFNRGIKGEFHVLLTSTAWENLQGWPFFGPGYVPGNTVNFYSMFSDCHDRFRRQQHFEHFPVEFDDTASKKNFTVLNDKDPTPVSAFTVQAAGPFGPGQACAFRIAAGGLKALFLPHLDILGPVLQQRGEWLDDLRLALLPSPMDGGFGRADALPALKEFVAKLQDRSAEVQIVFTRHDPSLDDRGVRARHADLVALLGADAAKTITLAVEGVAIPIY